MPRRIGEKITPPPRHFIRQWRDARGLTQEQLADSVGASTSVISRLETGRLGYTQALLEAVASALQASPVALLSVDPGVEGADDIRHMIDEMTKREREQAIRLLRAMRPSAA